MRDFRRRSDGTFEYSECILIKEKNKIVPLQKSFLNKKVSKEINITIWRLSDDENYANLALDAFRRLKENETFSHEVE